MATIKSYTKNNGEKFWAFQAYLGTDPLTGKRRKTTQRGFKTKKEAKQTLAMRQMEIEQKGFREENYETYEDVYMIWLEQYQNTVKESTLVKTKGLFRNHILPAFQNMRMKEITVLMCQKKVNQWFKELKRFSMVMNYAAAVFDYAITLDILEKNPMKLVTKPIRKNSLDEDKIKFYTKEELKEFFDCIEQDKAEENTLANARKKAFFRLLAFSGMRKGEAFALSWQDIDFKDNTIHINKALTRGESAYIIQTPKTKNAVRTIEMDDKTMTILQEWRKIQKIECLKRGFNTQAKTQIVFNNFNTNSYLSPTKSRIWLLSITNKHHLKYITTHGFRHTHCSLLFEAGATIKEVQDRLGHSDVQTTMNIYAHVTPKARKNTIDKFANYVAF